MTKIAAAKPAASRTGTSKPSTPKAATGQADSPSRLIDARIVELGDWRGKTLAHVRALIKAAVPGVV